VKGLLLDTNVLSELVKPKPDKGVVACVDGEDEDSIYVSALTLGEIRQGVEMLAAGRRRAELEAWVGGALRERFEGRVLAVDADVADRWGRLSAEARRAGRGLGVVDGLLAATALVHGFTLVTRNESDFSGVGHGLKIRNPWQ